MEYLNYIAYYLICSILCVLLIKGQARKSFRIVIVVLLVSFLLRLIAYATEEWILQSIGYLLIVMAAVIVVPAIESTNSIGKTEKLAIVLFLIAISVKLAFSILRISGSNEMILLVLVTLVATAGYLVARTYVFNKGKRVPMEIVRLLGLFVAAIMPVVIRGMV